jgi:transcriptional regulator of acetoin/glycerol metabolism
MTDRFESARVEKIKEGFLVSAGVDGKVVRGGDAELMQSWQRSQDALGEPANITDVPQVSEEVLDEQLLNTFRAPLTTFSDSLFGTGLGVLLADSRGQILHRWCEDRSAAVLLDRIGTIRGAVLAEDPVGTNGVGTVAAVGKSVQIQGTPGIQSQSAEEEVTHPPPDA